MSDIIEGYQGEINVSTKKKFFIKEKKKNCLPLLRGNLIKRYGFLNNPLEYCSVSVDTRQHWKNPRIIFQEVSNQQQKQRIKAVFGKSSVLCGHTTNYCFPKDKKVDIFYALALLNSKAVNYYFSYFNKTNHVPIGEIKNIPIPLATNEQQLSLAKKAKLITDLNEQLREIPANSNKWNSIKEEIEKTDKKIDEEVYGLYGLGEEEIKIVENNLKIFGL